MPVQRWPRAAEVLHDRGHGPVQEQIVGNFEGRGSEHACGVGNLNHVAPGLHEIGEIQTPEHPVFPAGYGADEAGFSFEQGVAGSLIDELKIERLLLHSGPCPVLDDRLFYRPAFIANVVYQDFHYAPACPER